MYDKYYSKDANILIYVKGVYTMATKKKYMKKNQDVIFSLFLLLVLFLLLSLIVPAIGAKENASQFWVSTVIFFESVKIHFVSFWMFYSFAAVMLIAYLGKK
jgi:lipopolysaccharide/colanic/teichoic acid biosynthesis glycosyltransferase